ncbi:MAG: RebB family R body protein [Cyanobacteria bacterium P01_F01_bin.150]
MPVDSNLPGDIRESIAIANAKSVAEQPAMLSNLTYSNSISNINLSQQNAVSNQQALNQLGITVTGKAVNRVSNLSPMEAVAVVKMDTGNDVAEQISDLKAAIAPLTNPTSSQSSGS